MKNKIISIAASVFISSSFLSSTTFNYSEIKDFIKVSEKDGRFVDDRITVLTNNLEPIESNENLKTLSDFEGPYSYKDENGIYWEVDGDVKREIIEEKNIQCSFDEDVEKTGKFLLQMDIDSPEENEYKKPIFESDYEDVYQEENYYDRNPEYEHIDSEIESLYYEVDEINRRIEIMSYDLNSKIDFNQKRIGEVLLSLTKNVNNLSHKLVQLSNKYNKSQAVNKNNDSTIEKYLLEKILNEIKTMNYELQKQNANQTQHETKYLEIKPNNNDAKRMGNENIQRYQNLKRIIENNSGQNSASSSSSTISK